MHCEKYFRYCFFGPMYKLVRCCTLVARTPTRGTTLVSGVCPLGALPAAAVPGLPLLALGGASRRMLSRSVWDSMKTPLAPTLPIREPVAWGGWFARLGITWTRSSRKQGESWQASSWILPETLKSRHCAAERMESSMPRRTPQCLC